MYEWILPLIVGVIAAAMAVVLLYRYRAKGRMHHLLWAVGLLLWALSDFTQMYALLFSWTIAIYLLYFFSSTMLAGFLGAGTLYLIRPKGRVSPVYLCFNIAMGIALVASLLMTPLDSAALQNAVAGAGGVSAATNYLAAVVNIPALITFVGGALYGFWKFRKPYALLIAIGGAVPAVGGTLAAVAIPALLPYTDLIGIAFLSAGFWLSFNSGHGRK